MAFRTMCLLAGLLLGGFTAVPSQAQAPAAPPKAAPEATGRIISVVSPIGDEVLGLVRRTVLELEQTASKEGRQAYLILEILPGTSPFHNCYALADFLTEKPFNGVTTVAWVPETVTGTNVLVALACRDIVMGPKASLGDMGNGKAVSEDEQSIVKVIIERRRNPRVSWSLAKAMMDPSAALLQLKVEDDEGVKESRLVTAAEARRLQDEGVVIADRVTISEAGTPGLISSTQARAREILAVRTAATKKDLIEGYQLSLDQLRELKDAIAPQQIAYIELHDVIDEVFSSFAQRQIQRAVSSGAKLIIFEIDSPGGLLYVCQDLSRIITQLSDKDIKTVAYIPHKAISGGAILAVACDEIYMLPNAGIGDAIPINLMGNMIVHAEAKILSVELQLLRELAKHTNRPAAVLEGMADKDLEVFEAINKTTGKKWYMSAEELHQNANEWTAGPRVPESRPGVAIMVDGVRAHELLVAESPVRDLAELRERLGIPADVQLRPIGRNWVDTLVFTLNHQITAGFLFFLAVVFIYLEMATMTGLFGILSALAFAIFFWSKVMGGTATGLEIALFVLGACCLMVEFFVIPGFGVFGVSGFLLVLSSLIMASQTFTGFSLEYDLAKAGKTFATLGAALFAVLLTSFFISQHLHCIPFLNELVLTGPSGQGGNSLEPRLRPDLVNPEAALLGSAGQSVTILRPAGKARIDGQVYDVVSDGPFIEEGTQITVVQVSKNRIVVRQA